MKSLASKFLIKEYNKLPENVRPFSDIRKMVKELDGLYDRKSVNKHFVWFHWISGHELFSWVNSKCNGTEGHDKDCVYYAYVKLHNAIKRLQAEVDYRNTKLKEPAKTATLQMIDDMTEQLRSETVIMCQVTNTLL